ncbi:MAG: DnaD domain protein [Erysipelotrichaceae bacterium]
MKWYKEKYVNRRDWIIDHYEHFNFSSNEGIVCLAVDFLNTNHIDITYDVLAKKTNLSLDEIDRTLSLLTAKKYIEIRATAKGLEFYLDGLFENEVYNVENIVNHSSFELFEQTFGRPLAANEMEKISEWLSVHDSKLLVYALKEAVLYDKLSMAYIDAILRDWKKKNLTVAKLQKGIRQ